MSVLTIALLAATIAAGPQVAADANAPPTRKQKLVVMNLVAERGVDEAVLRLLNELLLTQFAKSKKYDIIGGSDIQAILSAEAQKQAVSACTDTACLAEIGGSLGADLIAISSLGRIGDYYILNVKIINSRSGEVVNRWSEQVEGVENKLMLAVRRSVAAVVTDEKDAAAAAEAAEASVSTSGGGLGAPGLPSIIAWGIGGAGLIAGIVFGVVAKGHADHANDPTFVGGQLEIDAGQTLQTVANVSYIVGGVAVAAGAVLWLVPPARSGAAVALSISPTAGGWFAAVGGRL